MMEMFKCLAVLTFIPAWKGHGQRSMSGFIFMRVGVRAKMGSIPFPTSVTSNEYYKYIPRLVKQAVLPQRPILVLPVVKQCTDM